MVPVLVSLLIVLVVTHALFQPTNSEQALFAVQAELPDMQQRLRVSACLQPGSLWLVRGCFPSIVPIVVDGCRRTLWVLSRAIVCRCFTSLPLRHARQ